MSDVVIHVENISKRYRIGAAPKKAASLAQAARQAIMSPFQYLLSQVRGPSEDEILWALKDVSFDVKRGEIVGIVGRNGAGKSTLLKILSRITDPTEGFADIYGRIGALLEVGTGFHPELTGRENVYMNGTILGMRKAEIDGKFDEIVAFSGVEKFIDTPVKFYSSGMNVRLGFAVAAHLQTDILIVDEVLSVGDAEFQKKSLGKVNSLTNEGRTVLIVSHNMDSIYNLCDRALLMGGGKVLFDGPTPDTIQEYLGMVSTESGQANLENHAGRVEGMTPIAKSIRMYTSRSPNTVQNIAYTGDDLIFEIEYDCMGRELDFIQLAFTNIHGQRVFTIGNYLSSPDALDMVLRGSGCVRCVVPNVRLNRGEYFVQLLIGTQLPRHSIDVVDQAISFQVELGDYFGHGRTVLAKHGPLVQDSIWSKSE